jgi:hypothetical protein
VHCVGQKGHRADNKADADLRGDQDGIQCDADRECGIMACRRVMMVTMAAVMTMTRLSLTPPSCLVAVLARLIAVIMIVAVMQVIMRHAVALFDVPWHLLTSRPAFLQDIKA